MEKVLDKDIRDFKENRGNIISFLQGIQKTIILGRDSRTLPLLCCRELRPGMRLL